MAARLEGGFFRSVHLLSFPSPETRSSLQRTVDGLLGWLDDRLSEQRYRTTPVVLTDANDGVGLELRNVETGQRFFKKEPMDAAGFSDLAAQRREFLSQRLEVTKSIGGGPSSVGWMDSTALRSWSERSALRRNNWSALQPFSRQFGCECVVEDRV